MTVKCRSLTQLLGNSASDLSPSNIFIEHSEFIFLILFGCQRIFLLGFEESPYLIVFLCIDKLASTPIFVSKINY